MDKSTAPKQRTIGKEVALKGVGLHTGKEVTLTFKPAQKIMDMPLLV